MSEDTTAAAGTAGGDTAAADIDKKPPADAGGANLGDAGDKGGGTALGGSDDAGAGGADTPAGFPENWRELLAGDDTKELARLKRMSAPADLHKAYRALEKKVSSGQPIAPLADDAKPEEIAAYRKAAGIPDKAEGYGLAFPDEWKPNEADKAGLAAFQEYALAKNMTPAAAKTAFEFYASNMAAAESQRAEKSLEANNEAIAELRGEYRGSEFKRNMKIAEDFLAQHFDGEEKALDEVLNTALPNGVKIKNYPPFVKGLVKMARSYADEEVLIGGDGAGGGKSIDDEIAELRTKSLDGKLTKSEDDRYNQLLAARIARDNRRSARAA
jgi:hypothetical protein